MGPADGTRRALVSVGDDVLGLTRRRNTPIAPFAELDESDRVFLAAASRLLGRASRSFFVRPHTLLGWHRQLVRRRWTYAGRRPGRPAVSGEICELVLRVGPRNSFRGFCGAAGDWRRRGKSARGFKG
jgi:hypothetical protein